jgi:hypothetical protein
MSSTMVSSRQFKTLFIARKIHFHFYSLTGHCERSLQKRHSKNVGSSFPRFIFELGGGILINATRRILLRPVGFLLTPRSVWHPTFRCSNISLFKRFGRKGILVPAAMLKTCTLFSAALSPNLYTIMANRFVNAILIGLNNCIHELTIAFTNP